MDATAPKTEDLKSRVVRANDIAWEKTRFPGCEFKPLLLDKSTGMATVLLKMAPGATLPDHEHVSASRHDNLPQRPDR